jgi:hypothetical protein
MQIAKTHAKHAANCTADRRPGKEMRPAADGTPAARAKLKGYVEKLKEYAK